MTLENLQENNELIKEYIDSNSSSLTFDMLCETNNVYTKMVESSDGTTVCSTFVKYPDNRTKEVVLDTTYPINVSEASTQLEASAGAYFTLERIDDYKAKLTLNLTEADVNNTTSNHVVYILDESNNWVTVTWTDIDPNHDMVPTTAPTHWHYIFNSHNAGVFLTEIQFPYAGNFTIYIGANPGGNAQTPQALSYVKEKYTQNIEYKYTTGSSAGSIEGSSFGALSSVYTNINADIELMFSIVNSSGVNNQSNYLDDIKIYCVNDSDSPTEAVQFYRGGELLTGESGYYQLGRVYSKDVIVAKFSESGVFTVKASSEEYDYVASQVFTVDATGSYAEEVTTMNGESKKRIYSFDDTGNTISVDFVTE